MDRLSPPADPLYAAIGARILAARRRAKLSQGQLAEAVRLSRTSVTNIECGRQKIQIDTLYAVAEAVGVRPQALLPPAGMAMPERIQEELPESLPPETARWVGRVIAQERR